MKCVNVSVMHDFTASPPLSLYIHFPWCVRKCPYCDFNSHALVHDSMPGDEYIDALIRDLEFELPRIWGRRVTSIFLGGGTPNLFSVDAIGRLLSILRSHLNLTPGCEITLEANPGAVEAAHFRDYRNTGVNRLSLGVQTFADPVLGRLGRIHNGEQAIFAIELARQAGFDNINLDIMYGLPGQSVDDAIQDLEIAAGFNTSHLSWYQLTIEPNTVFYSEPPALPEEDSIWSMQDEGVRYLGEHGLRQYEVSAYARDDHFCVHNMNYWQFGDYLGIGAGAHGKITDCDKGMIHRFARHRIPESYMQLSGKPDVIVSEKQLSVQDTILEFMMNAMRLNDGAPVELFTLHTGLSIETAEEKLQQAKEKALLDFNTIQIKPTEQGRRYLNDLLQIFMDEELIYSAVKRNYDQ